MVEKPQTVALELSSACSFGCAYCDRVNWRDGSQQVRRRQHMEVDLFKGLVDELVTWTPPPALTISYEGESLFHPQLFELLAYLRASGVRPWLSTSLCLFDRMLFGALLETCSTIHVSLDGLLEEFTRIRGTAEQFHIVEEHLLELLKLRAELASTTEITVSMTVCPPVTVISSPIEEFLIRWHGKVDQIYFWQMTNYKEKITLACRQGVEKHLKNRRICTQPFVYLAVLSDGRISPCCNTSRFVLPGIDASSGLFSVLNSAQLQAFRRQHKKFELSGLCCEFCELWLENWLGDEQIMLPFGDRQLAGLLEGNSIRIPGELAI